MSNQQQQGPQPFVSPKAYISGQYQEACQDISAPPQEVFELLLFSFVKMKPEDRGSFFRSLKTDFNTFLDSVDLMSLEKEITGQIKAAELKLHNSLMDNFWAAPDEGEEKSGLTLA